MIDINQMIEDGVEQKLIDLASMDADALKTKVAMGLVNAPIYNQFIEESEINWDYAFAAGLISKSDAQLIKSYDSEETETDEPNA